MYSIGMTPPRDPDHETPGYLVWRLSMKWRAAVDREVANLGLTHAQYSMLASLYGLSARGHRPSQRELADWTGLDPVHVSKVIRALSQAGLVERSGHATDTRAVQLSPTDTGRAVITEAIGRVGALLDRLTEPLGGLRSARTRAFTRTLHTLLDVDP
jgi:MarR family transcriptional regulator, organic hydroperoxide resistance regulator